MTTTGNSLSTQNGVSGDYLDGGVSGHNTCAFDAGDTVVNC